MEASWAVSSPTNLGDRGALWETQQGCHAPITMETSWPGEVTPVFRQAQKERSWESEGVSVGSGKPASTFISVLAFRSNRNVEKWCLVTENRLPLAPSPTLRWEPNRTEGRACRFMEELCTEK